MQFSYQTTIKDYRVATHFGLFMRSTMLFRILRWLLPGGAIYLIGSYCGLWPFYPFVLFLLGAYVFWILLLLGNAELRIFRCSRQEAAAFQAVNQITLTDTRLSLTTPDKAGSFATPLSKMACVIKLKTVYLLYISAAQTLIVPCRDVPDPAAMDRILRGALDDRFVDMQENGGSVQSRSFLRAFRKGK